MTAEQLCVGPYVPEPRWQPIDTAPRDGRTVLVHLAARWNSAAAKIGWDTAVRLARWNVADGLWRLMTTNYNTCADHRLTHWMPVPEPPEPLGRAS